MGSHRAYRTVGEAVAGVGAPLGVVRSSAGAPVGPGSPRTPAHEVWWVGDRRRARAGRRSIHGSRRSPTGAGLGTRSASEDRFGAGRRGAPPPHASPTRPRTAHMVGPGGAPRRGRAGYLTVPERPPLQFSVVEARSRQPKSRAATPWVVPHPVPVGHGGGCLIDGLLLVCARQQLGDRAIGPEERGHGGVRVAVPVQPAPRHLGPRVDGGPSRAQGGGVRPR
jgi:hypothetical protein